MRSLRIIKRGRGESLKKIKRSNLMVRPINCDGQENSKFNFFLFMESEKKKGDTDKFLY